MRDGGGRSALDALRRACESESPDGSTHDAGAQAMPHLLIVESLAQL